MGVGAELIMVIILRAKGMAIARYAWDIPRAIRGIMGRNVDVGRLCAIAEVFVPFPCPSCPSRGWTALHQACIENHECSHEETIRVLVMHHQLNLYQVIYSPHQAALFRGYSTHGSNLGRELRSPHGSRASCCITPSNAL